MKVLTVLFIKGRDSEGQQGRGETLRAAEIHRRLSVVDIYFRHNTYNDLSLTFSPIINIIPVLLPHSSILNKLVLDFLDV